MQNTNRSFLVSLSEYDTLLNMNDRLIANGCGACIMKAFFRCNDLTERRCEKFRYSCDDCIGSWLNEPFGKWNYKLPGVEKNYDGRHEQTRRVNDLEIILVFAIRYALGRRTFAPSIVCDFVIPMLPVLSDNVINTMMRDIKEHGGCNTSQDKEVDEYGLVVDAYGDRCDYETWRDFYALVVHESKRRNNTT